jgi:anti-sigma factor RsiW
MMGTTRGLGCWLVRRRLSAYRDGELPPGGRLRVEAHLDRCGSCSGEVAQLNRLHAYLAGPEGPEVPTAVWDAFWPGVQARLGEPVGAPAPGRPRIWAERLWGPVAAHPRLAFGSALAATAVAVLAVVAPWQGPADPPRVTPVALAPGPAEPPSPPAAVVHSVETADPQSDVMVFANPESDLTVVWVFGLPRTDT